MSHKNTKRSRNNVIGNTLQTLIVSGAFALGAHSVINADQHKAIASTHQSMHIELARPGIAHRDRKDNVVNLPISSSELVEGSVFTTTDNKSYLLIRKEANGMVTMDTPKGHELHTAHYNQVASL